MDNASELKLLIKKYDESIRKCEQQIAEAKRKQTIARQALELLGEEGVTVSEIAEQAAFEPKIEVNVRPGDFKTTGPAPTATRPKAETCPSGSGISEAMRKIFKAHRNEYISAAEIYEELMKSGFHSGAADIKRDVHIRLYRWNKGQIIKSMEEGGIKKYQITEKKLNDS